MGNHYAFIIGTDYYNDAGHFIPLPFVRADARALYEPLLDPEQSHTTGWNLTASYENYKSAREVLDRPQRM